MKKYLKLPLYVVMTGLFSIGMTACSDNDDDYEGTRENAIKAIVEEYTAKTVIPTYEELATAAMELHTACQAMYTAGPGNVTTAQVTTAGEAWKKARRSWERSEAWLFGPAGDYDVDPHIDSWPLDLGQMIDLLADPVRMGKMDETGVYASSLDYGLLGFHAIEYMLFSLEGTGMSQSSKPHDTNYTTQELKYLVGVAGDLRNQCIILEAAWKGESNIAQAKRQILNSIRSMGYAQNYATALNDLAAGLCYADDMKNPVEGNASDFVNYLACAQSILGADGVQNIANEVGNIKIGNPTGQGLSSETEFDPDYIESPYSLNSITDFKDNVVSIENAYCGLQSSKSYNSGTTLVQPVTHSFSSYVASLNPALDTRVKAAITAAYNSIDQMKEPFAFTCDKNGQYSSINQAAINACNDLNDIFNEVLTLLGNQR